ncbi:MAG TPA: Calx-beta domain-containing protein [Acidimicrobiales bacterium]
MFEISAVDTGKFTQTGGKQSSFATIESILGATTLEDSFDFSDGAGLTGAVDDFAGDLTVSVLGFVKITGDYDFVSEAHDVTPTANGGPETAVTANVLSVSGATGTGGSGFLGVEPLGNPVGIAGNLGDFALAIFTSGTRAWHAFDGMLLAPEFVAFGDLDLGLGSISVVLYGEAADDTWLDHDVNPYVITSPAKTFDSPSTLLSVSVPASITIDSVIHASGTFTFARGGTMLVDVATGFTGGSPPLQLSTISGLPESDGTTFGRSADWSMIYNLPVTSLQVAATNLNVFFGDGFAWSDTDADNVIDQTELGSGTKGFLLAGADIGFLLLSGVKTGNTAFDALVKPKFYAVSGVIDSLGLVNITDFQLEALTVGIEVNQGKHWYTAAVGTPVPTIDWVESFGTSGFTLITPNDDPVFDFEGTPLVGFSADKTLLRISDAVHISGSFSFQAGPIEKLDIVTGFTAVPGAPYGTLGALLTQIDVSTVPDDDDDDPWEEDPGTLARSSDYGILYNVEYRTVQIGASGVSVFLGWAEGLSSWTLAGDTDGILSRDEFDAITTDPIGVFISDLALGMVFGNAIPMGAPLTTLPVLLPRVFAMDSLAAEAGWVGFEDVFEFTTRNVGIEINSGTAWAGSSATQAVPVVDWKASFGSSGYEVKTGTTDAAPSVFITHEGTALIGFAADKALLQISEAVHISGSFSIKIGQTIKVDVVTGFSAIPGAPYGTLGSQLTSITVSGVDDVSTDDDAWEEDPGDGTLKRSSDYGIIYNLPIRTFEFGGSGISAFLGWADGLSTWTLDGDNDGVLSLSEFEDITTDPIGVLITGLDIGIVAGSAALPLAQASLQALLPRFVAVDSLADSAGWQGFEDVFELDFRDIGIQVNSATPWISTPAGLTTAAIDWVRSFGNSGYEVETGSTDVVESVFLTHAGTPLFGIAADKALLQISDAVHISGSFSVKIGPVEKVDVITGFNAAPTDPTLALNLTKIPVSTEPDLTGGDEDGDTWEEDPGDGTLKRSSDYGIIYNIPIRTLQFGASGLTVFLGWAEGLGDWDWDNDTDGVLSLTEFEAETTDPIGVLVTDLDLGMVLGTPDSLEGLLLGVDAYLPRFLALDSLAASAGWQGFEEYFELDFRDVGIEINSATPWYNAPATATTAAIDWVRSYGSAGFAVDTGATDVSEPVYLTHAGTPLVGIAADKALLQISDAVHLSGSFSIKLGPVEKVDVVTGLSGAPADPTLAAALFLIDPSTEADVSGDGDSWEEDPGDGSFKRSTDYGILYNMPIRTLQFGAADVTMFLGWADGLSDWDWENDADGVLSLTEFEALTDDPIGVLVTNLDFGMVVGNPEPFEGVGLTTLHTFLPSFVAVESLAASAGWVGFEDVFTLTFRNLGIEINQGTPWQNATAGSTVPTIDWIRSYGSSGFQVQTGATAAATPVNLKHTGPLIGVGADRALLKISDVVHISGSFSIRIGPVEYVDIVTGFNGAPSNPTLAAALALIPLGDADLTGDDEDGDPWEEDPGEQTLARSTDYGIIYNLPVSTLQIGASDVSVFLGWAPGLSSWNLATDDDGKLSLAEFNAITTNPVGLLVTDLDLGLVLADPEPLEDVGLTLLHTMLPNFVAFDSLAESAGWKGFEEVFEFTLRNVAVQLNEGTAWTGPDAAATHATIDWVRSYGSGGFSVATGATEASTPVAITFTGTPLVGFAADRVLLKISDAVHISGGFAVKLGPVEKVDISTGFTGAPVSNPTLSAALTAIPVSSVADVDSDGWEEDPDDGTIARTTDYGIIYNIPVRTLQFGATGVSVFLGWAPGLSSWNLATDDDGVLSRAEFDLITNDPIGFFVGEVKIGLLAMTVAPIQQIGLTTLPQFLPEMFALSSFAEVAGVVGFEDVFQLEIRKLAVEVNRGTPWASMPDATLPVVDWKRSFPDTDGSATDDVAGFAVATGATGANAAVELDFDGTPLIGVSADRVLLKISDAVHISGGFSFRIGPVLKVDVVTGLNGAPTDPTLAAQLTAVPVSAVPDSSADEDTWQEDPGDGSLKRSSDYGILFNVPVQTIQIGATDVSVFLGWAPGLSTWSLNTDNDGVLSRDEFDTMTTDPIGFFISNLDIGMVSMTPAPLQGAHQLLPPMLPKMFALNSTADELTLVGLEEYLDLTARMVGVQVNYGTAWATMPTVPMPTVDWKKSFPDTDGAGTDDVAGFAVRTGTTQANTPVELDFEGTQLIALSADRMLLQVSDFVHVSGGFKLVIGPVRYVDIATGLRTATGPLVTPLVAVPLANADGADPDTLEDDPGGTTLARTGDFSILYNVPVRTMQLGVDGASVFIGYAPGLTGWSLENDGDGVLSLAELQAFDPDTDPVGFFVGNLDLGFMIMDPVPFQPNLADPLNSTKLALNGVLPRMFAIKAEADDIALLGIPGVDISGHGVRVEVNIGNRFASAPPQAPPPAVDWVRSFPDTDGAGTTDVAGYAIETSTTGVNDPVELNMRGFLIGGGAENIHIELGEFVYIDGAIYFEIGQVHTVQLADAILPITEVIETLGLDESLNSVLGATEKDLAFMTIGGQNLHAFFGVNGPYWEDADADGVIDRHTSGPNTGQIIDAETNDDAIGLVIDDLTFGVAIMTPIDPIDPSRYIALNGRANLIGLVGLEEYFVFRAQDLLLEVNLSTPLVSGFPILPVVDFIASFPDQDGVATGDVAGFGVKTGARTTAGADIVVELTMDSLLIKAGIGFMTLDVMGLVSLSGAFGIEIGPSAEVTLVNGSEKTVKILTFGASNVYGFVGFNGPYIADWNGNGYIDKLDFNIGAGGAIGTPKATNSSAVGFAINDLDVGLFIGLEVDVSGASLGTYLAGELEIGSFGFVGLSALTAVGTLGVAFNIGLSTSDGASPIDFEESFPEHLDEDGNTVEMGYHVFTGDLNNPILLQFDDFLIKIELAGALNLANTFVLVGIFTLQVDSQGLKLLAAGELLVGPDRSAYSSTATTTVAVPGGNRTVSGGISSSASPILSISVLGALVIKSSGIALDIDVDLDVNIPGLGLTVSARVLLNTTGVDQEIAVPERLTDFLDAQVATGGVLGGLAAKLLARLDPCVATTGECYVIDGSAPDLTNAAMIDYLLFGGTNPNDYQAAGSYVTVIIHGTFDFLGFATGTGHAGVAITPSSFQLVFDLSFNIGAAGIELKFKTTGTIALSNQGIYINLALSLNFDITSVFHVEATGTVEIDTRPAGTSSDFFKLTLNGRLDIAGLVSVSGGFIFEVQGYAWHLGVNNLGGSLGPLSLHASGDIYSNGTFNISITASIDIGVDGFGIHGSLSASASVTCATGGPWPALCSTYRLAVSVSGSVSAEAFGLSVGASLSASFSVVLGVETTAELEAEVCVDFGIFGDACADVHIGNIRVPISIFPTPPPRLAQYASGDQGELQLNVGSNASRRTVETSNITEDYRLRQLGFDGTYYTVRVEAFGYAEVFSKVTRITGDFGSGNDSMIVLPSAGTIAPAGFPMEIRGGTGNDLLSYTGTGAVKFYGDDNDDTLISGDGVDTLEGGSGNDYLDARGGVDNPMVGGLGNDIFYAVVSQILGETITANQGNDVVEISGTTGSDTFAISPSGGNILVTYTGTVSGSATIIGNGTTLFINPRSGTDGITLTGDLASAGVAQIKLMLTDGPTEVADTIVMNLLSGADNVTITGSDVAPLVSNLRSDGVIALPVISGGTGAATSVPTTTATWLGKYTLVLSDSDHVDTDLLTIKAGDGVDTITVTSTKANLQLEGEGSGDIFHVGNAGGSGTVENIDAGVNVIGGDGGDTLHVNDAGDTTNQVGQLTSTVVSGLGLHSDGVTYSVETLFVNLGTGNDEFNVRSSAAGTQTNVQANNGDDVINVSSDAPTNAGFVDVLGTLTINGQGGSDTLKVSDDGDTTGDTGVLNTTTLTGLSAGTIIYGTVETMRVDLGTGHDAFIVTNTGATTTTVNANNGTDGITINGNAVGHTLTVNGEADGDTVTVTANAGTVVVNGDAGTDSVTVTGNAGTLTVNGNTENDTVLITATAVGSTTTVNGNDGADFVAVAVGMAGTATVNGNGGDDDIVVRGLTGALTVNGNEANDWVGVLATLDDSTLTINGNDGDDVFEVGSEAEVGSRRTINAGGILDNVDGTVTINGNAPSASDYLYVDDTGDDLTGSGESGTLTSTTITGLGMETGITYGTIEHLRIDLGDDGTVFNVLSTNAGTDSVVNTGGGTDTINVSTAAPTTNGAGVLTGTLNLVAGHLTINGEGGSDTAYISDAGDATANTGTLTSTVLTGLGMGSQGITYSALEFLNIDLGTGGDTFTIESTHTEQTDLDTWAGGDTVNIETIAGYTLVDTGADADTINVGSSSGDASPAPGTVNGILALLDLQAGSGDDTVNVDDTGDATQNVGVLTGGTIEGLGTVIGSAFASTPSDAVHVFTITNAFDGTFTLTIGGQTTVALDFDASVETVRAALLTALNAIAGGTYAADDLDITRTLNGQVLVFTIAFTGDLAGLAGRNLGALTINGTNLIGIAQNGAVGSSASSMTSGRILYAGVETLDIDLGSGDDVLHVRSTHIDETFVDGGTGQDTLMVETVLGDTTILGNTGNDTLVINPIPNKPDTSNGIGDDALVLDGQVGSDLYIVNVWSTGNSGILIHDSAVGDVTGFDRLTINGTGGDDQFLLRAIADDSSGVMDRLGLVALLGGYNGTSFTTAERIVYDNTIDAGVTVNGLGGDDHFALDDNSSVMTINGGSGADVFQVGQIYGDTTFFDADWPAELLAVTRGQLSNGISFATTINGGDGPDQFYVFHNLAVLTLNGDGGDDSFVVRTFLHRDEETRIQSGAGRDLIEYVANAPVAIDGGDGFDTVVIIGTEADDDFVITQDGVYGAGRYVSFRGVERVDIDGAEGDDEFFVLSTPQGVQVRIFGGLGSDTINVGADAPAVFGDDLLGHTGLVANSVESTTGAWDLTHIDGIAAEIADNDEPVIVITESAGGTRVWENGSLNDSYTVVLTKAPTASVVVTVSAPSRSPDAELDRSYSIQVSLDGITWTDAVTLVFTTGNWNVAQTVYVRAYADFSSEGPRSASLQHLVVSDDLGYEGMPVNNVAVEIVDNDAAGVVIVESGVDTVVVEGGATDGYVVSLTRQPLTNVTVTLHTDGETCVSTATDANLDCGDVVLTFTTGIGGNWATPQSVTIRANNDGDIESFHFSYVTHSVSSADVFGGAVVSVNGSRITISGPQFAAGALRGYVLRVTGGVAGGESWMIWNNEASVNVGGVWHTVINIQGAIDESPQAGDPVYVNGYTAPVATGVLTGTVGAIDLTDTTITVVGLTLPTANGGLSGATVRIFLSDGSTEFRTISSNTATTITFESAWDLDLGQEFSIVDVPGVSPDSVFALVADNDTPSVLVTQTDGSTRLIEGVGYDTYTVVLTKDPMGETVTITIDPLLTETFNQPDGQAGYRNVKQVCVSTTAPSGPAPTAPCAPITLTFTSGNWNVAQTVYVYAIDDNFVDGSDLQAFADSAQRVHLIQGPLYVDGGIDEHADRSIPPPVLLPGETSTDFHLPISPSIDVDEANQVDTLNVFNQDSVSDDSGVLTSDRLTGLGMAPDQFTGGRFLLGGIEYGDLEALNIHLGRGSDDLLVKTTHSGTTVVTGGAGNDDFDVRTIDGHTNIQGDAGNDLFRIGTTVPVFGGVLDDLDAVLVIDGGVGSDTAHVDDSGDPATNSNLGTLTQTTITGLEMVSTSVDNLYSLTIGSTTTSITLTITVPGDAPVVVVLPTAGLTAATLQAALQAALFPVLPQTLADPRPFTGCGLIEGTDGVFNTRCAQSVFVWQHGGDFLIGFRGELHGVDVGLEVDPTIAGEGTATDYERDGGINYYGFDTTERLHIYLGAGHDLFNVRGTIPWTTLETRAGDDVVFVSDTADLGSLAAGIALENRDLDALHDAVLHGYLTLDDLEYFGSLDLVLGRIDVVTGTGSNTLSISDRDDANADTAVVMTDSTISGLAPGLITYSATDATGDLAGQGYWTQQGDSGLFGRGVNVYFGQGNDVVTVNSVDGGALATSLFGATVTTLFGGGGNDTITLSVSATAAQAAVRRLVVHGNAGDDTINAGASSLPVVVFGDAGGDTITGGTGNDQLFGDDARVHYLEPASLATTAYDVVFGGTPVGSTLPTLRDAAFLTPDLMLTRDTTIGGADTINAGAGRDIVFGGRGGDTIHGDADNDLVLGDFGRAATKIATGFVDANALPLALAISSHPFEFFSTNIANTVDSGGDTIYGDGGDDILMGQQGSDSIFGGDGNDDIWGGHNVATGVDAGVGTGVHNGDLIDAGTGSDVVLGDNGTILRTGPRGSTLIRELNGTTIYDGVVGTTNAQIHLDRYVDLFDHANDTSSSFYGNDTIAGGAGNDLVFGQLGNDTLHGDGTTSVRGTVTANTTGDGDDHVEGGGGNDTIRGGIGQDNLIGGSSDLFGLATPAERPDGSDTVYGGNDDADIRNLVGGTDSGADADAILGDNGNLFWLVTSTGWVNFTYDQSTGRKVIARVVVLHDYSPIGDDGYWSAVAPISPAAPVWTVGTNTNIGGGDFLHGESGDDLIHGMTGNDALFGEAHNDDLYGESGEDWISGGTGDDGIVGDDGRIYTSRNGSTELLYGLGTANGADTYETPGDLQLADVYIGGELHKRVELDHWTLGTAPATYSNFYIGANDVIFGGWGNDFIHAGEGDDAVSGGEATTTYYTDDPWATLASLGYATTDVRGVLQWSPVSLEFAWYDEFNALRRIVIPSTTTWFLLVNDATENQLTTGDGKDTLFGDGGNDWLVGGTGHDRLFGGWGDDMLNVDDDLSTAGGENTGTDTSPALSLTNSYADIAYGGAGRDILVANTGADRMMDWVGEYNSYLVPFSPYGAFAISRMISPAIQQYLIDLAEAQGADVTRDGDLSRNGEPYAELGMVVQQDPQWQDQTGAPADPQAGNLQGRRDVLRYESFADAVAALKAFAIDSGSWSVVNGRYESKAIIDGDAVSLFYVDAMLPRYFEVTATVNADKPKAGYKANAYVVFDYQGSTDFKYAGIDISTGKVQIGKRTASGWQVLAQANWTLFANRDYDLVVAVNGQVVTLYVDGVLAISYTFASPLNDPTDPYSGVVDPLTDGMIGVASNGAIMRLGQMGVRTLAPEITYTQTEEFDATPSGWTVVGGGWSNSAGNYMGTPGAAPAIATTTLGVAPGAVLILETSVRTTAIAGIVFDLYADNRFKFVMLDVATGRVVIGHRTSDGWFEDASASYPLVAGTFYNVKVTLDGNVVTVLVDGNSVLSFRYASLLNDGAVGVIARNAPAAFGSFTMQTDDPELTPALPFVSVGDATVVEGPAGTRTVTVTITLSRASDQPVTVVWSTVDGAAVAGADYQSAGGSVTFAPGETSKTITLVVVGDATQEADETFTVVLTGPTGALLGDASGIVSILNDDVPAVVTVVATDNSASESGDVATFVVTRNGDISQSLAVALAWSGVAGYGVDYTISVTGGTLSSTGTVLTLAPGVASATITVTAKADTLAEAAESLALTIQPNAAYGVGSPSSATAVVQDAGGLPTLSVLDASVVEGDRGTWVTITVELSAPSSVPVTVELRTYDGTARAASDYKAFVTTVTFAPGQTTMTVQLRILGDRSREGNEVFTVQLSNPTGAVLARSVGTVTIIDDDGGMLLAGLAAPAGHDAGAPLTQADLDAVVAVAVDRWIAAGVPASVLRSVRFVIADLGERVLARVEGNVVYVDADAAGWGWFTVTADGTVVPTGRMDLLTTLLHELGHVLGLDHAGHGLMASALLPGTRDLALPSPSRIWARSGPHEAEIAPNSVVEPAPDGFWARSVRNTGMSAPKSAEEGAAAGTLTLVAIAALLALSVAASYRKPAASSRAAL